LRSVVAQESIEVGDDDVDAEIRSLAEQTGEKPEKVRRDLEQRGVLEAVRSDLARGKALTFLIDHAEVVDHDGNPVDLTIQPVTEPDGDSADTAAEVQTTEAPEEEPTA